MKKAGIREARQQLSSLLEIVAKGREVVITDRGREVARLVPPRRPAGTALPDLSYIRRRIAALTPALSQTLRESREDRF